MSDQYCIDASSGAEDMNVVKEEDEIRVVDIIKEEGKEEDGWEEKKNIKEEELNDYTKISHFDEEDEPKLVMIQGKKRSFWLQGGRCWMC